MTYTSTSIQRFYRYYLLLIAIFAISCKKEAGLVNVPPPDQSTSPIVKELYAQWVSYTKDHPTEASLKPNEKLDWQKMALRISSDAKRSINYYIPILNDNLPCNRALELSFGTEKSIFQAAVRTYTTPSAKSGSSSEARRLQTILYNFSAMGLTIPQTVIDREKTIQQELKRENTASKKNQKISFATKDRSVSSVTQSPRSCQTATTFDFYYTFSGYPWNEYSVYNNHIQIANDFRSEVFSYMKNVMNLDYDMPMYGAQNNNLTFYNISDNDQLGDMIHIALDHAAGVTKTYYSLQQSSVGYYFYDVLHSTCGASSGGGTGGSGIPSPPKVPSTINNKVTDPCLHAAVDDALLQNKNLVGEMANIIKNFDSNKSVDISIYDGDIFYSNGQPKPGQTTKQLFRDNTFTADITIGKAYHQGTSKESLVTSLIHEVVHAYLGYTSNGFLQTQTHDVIAAKYVTPMAEYLKSSFNITLKEAYGLAWSGIPDSNAWSEAADDFEFTMSDGNKITKSETKYLPLPFKDTNSEPTSKGHPICP